MQENTREDWMEEYNDMFLFIEEEAELDEIVEDHMDTIEKGYCFFDVEGRSFKVKVRVIREDKEIVEVEETYYNTLAEMNEDDGRYCNIGKDSGWQSHHAEKAKEYIDKMMVRQAKAVAQRQKAIEEAIPCTVGSVSCTIIEETFDDRISRLINSIKEEFTNRAKGMLFFDPCNIGWAIQDIEQAVYRLNDKLNDNEKKLAAIRTAALIREGLMDTKETSEAQKEVAPITTVEEKIVAVEEVVDEIIEVLAAPIEVQKDAVTDSHTCPICGKSCKRVDSHRRMAGH